MDKEKDWEYEVKCRRCGAIARMFHSHQRNVDADEFIEWARAHSSFPIQKQCSCNNGMITFHDLVSYGSCLDLLFKEIKT